MTLASLVQQKRSVRQMARVLGRCARTASSLAIGNGELIKGADNASAVGTLVKRTSRLQMLVQLPEYKPASAANVM